MTSQQAFSFLELMIVLTIIALLALFTLPWSHELMAHRQSLLLRTQFITKIRAAQQMASTLQLPITLCQSEDRSHCGGSWLNGQLMFVDIKQDGRVHQQKDILARYHTAMPADGQLFLRVFPYYRNYLLFSPDGMLADTNGTFWYCGSNAENPEWAIVLNRSGRVRVINPDRNGRIRMTNGEVLLCSPPHPNSLGALLNKYQKASLL